MAKRRQIRGSMFLGGWREKVASRAHGLQDSSPPKAVSLPCAQNPGSQKK